MTRTIRQLYDGSCNMIISRITMKKTLFILLTLALVSDPAKGIQKGEPIASFDDFKGVNWVYEYKGKLINCAVSKYGGMKSLDTFDLRFGR